MFKHILATILMFISFSAFCAEIHIGMPVQNERQRYAYKYLAEQFNKHNPDYTINYYPYELNSYFSLYKSMLTGRIPVDVMLFRTGQPLYHLADKKMITPLSGEFKNSLKDYPEDVIKAVTYNGKLYGVPHARFIYGIFYNKIIFGQYGLNPPKTMKELNIVCAKLKKAGYIPLIMGGYSGLIESSFFDYINIRLNGSEFHSELMSGRTSFLDDRVINTFNYIKHMKDSGYFSYRNESLTQADAAPYLYRKEAAMMFGAGYFNTSIPKSLSKYIGFIPFPASELEDGRASDAPILSFAIPSVSKNQDGADKFIRFLMRPDIQTEFDRIMGNVPVNKKASYDDKNPVVKVSAGELFKTSSNFQNFGVDTTMHNPQSAVAVFKEFMKDGDTEKAVRLLEILRLEEAVRQ